MTSSCSVYSQELEEKLRGVARSRIGESDRSHDLSHLERVWANALIISADEPVNHNILMASVWLHDIVLIEKTDPRRPYASRYSAAAATEILRGWAWPNKAVEEVKHAIEAHSFSARIAPQTIEAAVLHDADQLDSLGAIGVARIFYIAGRIRSALYDVTDPWAHRRPLDDHQFALDHFKKKLLLLEEEMLTKGGRQLACRRTEFMHSFLQQLDYELYDKEQL